MFTKIKSIITNHANQHDALTDTFLEGKKNIYQKNEYTMSFKDREFAELKAKYDVDRLALIQNSKIELGIAFNEIMSLIEFAVTADIGQETIAELQVLMNTKVSEFEINAYAKKYAGKFKALRIINQIAQNSGVPFTYVSDADVIRDLNEVKAMAVAFLNEYTGRTTTNEYIPRYLLANADDTISEGNRFTVLGAEINDFLNPVAGVDM